MAGTESVSQDDLIVCARGDQEFTARDAIDAALFRGELDSKWKEFLRCVESEKRADELDLELDDDAIATAAEAFRYEHDLITAEETEAFLANRGLTLDDFTDYFTRHYYASAIPEKVLPENIDYISASAELRQLFTAELILSAAIFNTARNSSLFADFPPNAEMRSGCFQSNSEIHPTTASNFSTGSTKLLSIQASGSRM